MSHLTVLLFHAEPESRLPMCARRSTTSPLGRSTHRYSRDSAAPRTGSGPPKRRSTATSSLHTRLNPA